MARTRYSNEQKMRVVREALETGNTAAVARRHGIHTNAVYNWVKQYRESGEEAFLPRKRSQDLSNQHALERENAKLKTLLGEKELEIAILRDLVKKTNRP